MGFLKQLHIANLPEILIDKAGDKHDASCQETKCMAVACDILHRVAKGQNQNTEHLGYHTYIHSKGPFFFFLIFQPIAFFILRCLLLFTGRFQPPVTGLPQNHRCCKNDSQKRRHHTLNQRSDSCHINSNSRCFGCLIKSTGNTSRHASYRCGNCDNFQTSFITVDFFLFHLPHPPHTGKYPLPVPRKSLPASKPVSPTASNRPVQSD